MFVDKIKVILLIVVPALVLGACNLNVTRTPQAPPDLTQPIGAGSTSPSSEAPFPAPADPNAIIQPETLEYLGAFRLPGESGSSNWDYSGRGLTYYPDGDPSSPDDGYPGSLFGVGHDYLQYVSEISIPIPIISKNPDDLNTAVTLQPFADITGGMFGETELPRLGLQYLPPQGQQTGEALHFVHGQHFQGFEPSHGWSELTLANSQPAGPWLFGDYTNYATTDYVFEVPAEWASRIPGGYRLVTGRFREGVWGGRGPTLFAYSPWQEGNPPPVEAKLQSITPLLLYGVQLPGETDIVSDESMQMIGYIEPDHWWGGAWLTVGERSAVVFVGTKAMGKGWYGFSNGVVWEYDCADTNPPTCPDVPEWPYDNRGYWAEGYQAQIIFYNPADLVAVANGEMETWQPQPYASLDLNETFLDPNINLADYKYDLAGAVAFDRENSLLYIIERLADEYKSVVHVWRIR